VTCYLGTNNSSEETNSRAKKVAESIGSKHFNLTIDEAYHSIINIFKTSTGLTPKYDSEGGTWTEDIALQNI
jgi:NAD+ synthase (glutamine-hydrolysing)